MRTFSCGFVRLVVVVALTGALAAVLADDTKPDKKKSQAALQRGAESG